MRLRDILDGDDGFALAVVMGAIAVITVVAITGFAVSRNALGDAMRLSAENRAYQAASSGLELEIPAFKPDLLPTGRSESGYVYGNYQSINGTDRYTVTVANKPGSSTQWVMKSLGQSGTATETVEVTFTYFDLWDMNISGGSGSWPGMREGFNGNATIIGAIYVNGRLDWTASSAIYGGPIMVAGENPSVDVLNRQNGGSTIGTIANPIDLYLDNDPTGQTDYINQTAFVKGSAPTFELPVLDSDNMSDFLSLANRVYNTDLVIGEVANGGAGNFGDPAVDKFWYKDGVLYCDEVVYVKGKVTFANNMVYRGKGMIVAEGSGGMGFEIQGRLVPDKPWETLYGVTMPACGTDAILGLVSPGDIYQSGGDWVSGAIYINGDYVSDAGGQKESFRGSIICNSINFEDTNCVLATQVGLGGMIRDEMRWLGSNIYAQGDWLRY